MITPSIPDKLPSASVASEVGPLARESVAAFHDTVEAYKRHLNLTTAEALALANKPVGPALDDRPRDMPPDQMGWSDLYHLEQRDPELALKRWGAVKQAALDELRSGHRAALAMEVPGLTCWPRAQFLAIREDLSAEWQPKNGIERELIDAMAQAQTATHHWLKVLTTYSTLHSIDQDRAFQEGKYTPPRTSDSEAIEQAAAMVDRFNRIFLRTMRALRDLRRYASPVVVQNAKQVNIGDRQVNVTSRRSKRKATRIARPAKVIFRPEIG